MSFKPVIKSAIPLYEITGIHYGKAQVNNSKQFNTFFVIATEYNCNGNKKHMPIMYPARPTKKQLRKLNKMVRINAINDYFK